VSGNIERLGRCGTLLLLCGALDGAEDRGNFAFKSGELKVDDAAPGVEDDIHRGVERGEIVANRFAHAALDAVAIDCLAHYFADSETDARAFGVGAAQRCAVGAELRTQSEEVRHLLRELFAASLVDALIVSVFAEAEDNGSGCHTAGLDLNRVESHMTQF